MVFVADDLGAWLVGLLADAGRKKLTALVLGSDQKRALRKAAADAVQGTAAEMNLSAEQARQLATAISRAFRKPIQDTPLAGSVTMLEVLQTGIDRLLAVPDNAARTAAGQLSAEVLGVPGTVLAETLTGHLVREIMRRGSGGGPLAPLADQLNHDLTHLQGQRVEGMLARLVALVIAASAPSGAGDPAREVGPARPPGAVQVSEADLRRLGVHAAISVPGVPDEVPPEYVPRDVDAVEFGVQAKVAAAAERGGFVLLVGGSSVGKTRCAVEVVRALLPGWWLVHPVSPAEVATLAGALSPQTVVWLDELQRYLDGEHGLTGGVIRALLNAPHPAVIIGTIWPDRYTSYTALPAPGGADPQAREREVLELAAVIRIGPEFSPAEQDRAYAAAARDPRLRVALEAAGYGLTQTLAAAPQLVARWRDAQTASPYAWAVVTAALDAARRGARAPLSADLLRAAAPGYLTSQQQAEAPEDWFEQALAYATGKLHGAAAALSPAGAGMGQVAGYTAADYLVQHASRERRSARVPASTWDAILSHIRDLADTSRVADSAKRRLLYRYAIPLYRLAADAGDGNAVLWLADLLAGRGDPDGAAQVLRARAEAGDMRAAYHLAELLAERGEPDEGTQILRGRADAGDRHAARQLALLLELRGDPEEAAQILRTLADDGDEQAAQQLGHLRATHLFGSRNNPDWLRARADAGDSDAARRLATLRLTDVLADHVDLDVLRVRADAGDRHAAWRLARLLAQRGDLDGLRTRADTGDSDAARRLAGLLTGRGNLEEAEQILRILADAGDSDAASQLAGLLAQRGDLDGLRTRADTGDRDAAWELTNLLTRRGDLKEAEQILRARADAGDERAAWRLADLLTRRGDLKEAEQILRARADAGDRLAAWRLADLLAERGDLDELRAMADAGDRDAARRLAGLLTGRGNLEEAEQILRTLADAGDSDAVSQLAGLLAERGDLDGAEQILGARADVGDVVAAVDLARLLAERGDLDELRTRADAEDGSAARELARLLAERGDLDELRTRADAGDSDAASQLPDLLTKQGRGEEAKRLRRFGLNPDGSTASA